MDDIDALELVGWGTPHLSQRQQPATPSDRTIRSRTQNVPAFSKSLFPVGQDAAPIRPAIARRPIELPHSHQQHVGFADSEVDLLTIDSEFDQPANPQRPQGFQSAQQAISKRAGPASIGPSSKRLLLSQNQGQPSSQPVFSQQLPRPPAAALPPRTTGQPAAARLAPASTSSTQQPACQVSIDCFYSGLRRQVQAGMLT